MPLQGLYPTDPMERIIERLRRLEEREATRAAQGPLGQARVVYATTLPGTANGANPTDYPIGTVWIRTQEGVPNGLFNIHMRGHNVFTVGAVPLPAWLPLYGGGSALS